MSTAVVANTRGGRRVAEVPDPVRRYLNEIGAIPLLTATEEVELAKEIEAGLYAAELLRRADSGEGEPPVDRADLETVAREGVNARDRMIRANLRLVVAAARKRRAGGLGQLELIQEGNLGLIHAVEKFDYTKGYKFSTYAMWWIRQAMQRGSVLGTRLIRLPEHAAEQLARIDRVEPELALRLGHDPTAAELAAETGIAPRRVSELRRAARVTASLDGPVGEDGDTVLGDLLAETEAPRTADEAERERAQLAGLLDRLSPLEHEIVAFRYGLHDGRPHTLRETAERFSLSSSRVRSLEEHALTRLRDRRQWALAA